MRKLVEATGFEPVTPCLQSRCSPTELSPQPERAAGATAPPYYHPAAPSGHARSQVDDQHPHRRLPDVVHLQRLQLPAVLVHPVGRQPARLQA